ncbi:MAG: aldehyde dehydrogenase EutE [Phycisphaerae bacterium]|nr:aldehyde dehydrogenase EutE [Phycisphaerae bacterium]
MSRLSDQQVDLIARRVREQLAKGVATPAPAPTAPPIRSAPLAPAVVAHVSHPETPGVFNDLDSAIGAAAQAYAALDAMTLTMRDKIIASIRESMLANAEVLAREAQRETGMGRWEDKLTKNRVVAQKTPGTEAIIPEARSGDHGLMLMERAPFGVIGAITPSTNPTSTIICNTIGMLAAGNSVVFNVHPGAKRVSIRNVALLNQAIMQAGGPANLVTTLTEPTIATAQAMMKHPGIRLLVVTGGPGVVAAAMQSGKRAVCAGPGNPPVVVDESADIALAGREIVRGASFDNNVICVDEKETFVVASVADQLLAAMRQNGAVVLDAGQTKQIENVIFKERHGPRAEAVMNKDMIGKNASVILSAIGMNVGEDVRLAVIDVDSSHPLVWSEQLMPVMPVVRVPDVDTAIDLANTVEGTCRHTAVMYSRNIEKLSRMARVMNCSIFVKNGPAICGLGAGGEGHASFSIASPTGEGLTGPRSFSRERRCVLVDHFRII